MKPRCGLYGVKSLSAGLIVSHILFSLQLYTANHRLYERTQAMIDAGYLVVPNARIAADLTKIGSAFYGALFFSLSVGTALSLGALAAAWAWDRLGGRKSIVLGALYMAWAVCLIAVNAKGFCPWISAVFIAVPLASFLVAIRWMTAEENDWRHLAVAVLPVAILAGTWLFQFDAQMMIDIRDGLLLSNPLGRKINDFYYRYTLYPAEVFKSLDQKLIKTVGFDSSVEPSLQAEIEKRISNYDYLKMQQPDLCDLWIRQTADHLILEHNARPVMSASVKTFFSWPSQIISEFSRKTDQWAFYRHFSFMSVLIGLPILFYIGIYAVAVLAARALSLKPDYFAAAGICLGAGLVLLVVFQASRPSDLKISEIPAALVASRWQDRVGALKFIEKNGLEIANYPVYSGLLSSTNMAERYWLVKCLGISQRPETFKLIQDFLEDPQVNVACMAYQALGRRKHPESQQVIFSRIASLRHYYIQWYAYKALRNLGWRPKRLTEKSF